MATLMAGPSTSTTASGWSSGAKIVLAFGLPPGLTSHCMRAFTCIHASPSTPMAHLAGAGHAAPGCVTAWCCGGSALLLGVQECEGVVDALLEDLVGELSVGQGAGELEGPDHQGEDAEGLHACRLRIVGC